MAFRGDGIRACLFISGAKRKFRGRYAAEVQHGAGHLGYRARLITIDGYSLMARTRGRWSLRALLAPAAGRLSFALSALSASASALVPPPVAAFLSSAAQLTSEALAGAATSVCGSASLALLAAAFAPLPLATPAMLAVADNVSFLAFLRLVQEGIEPNPGEVSTRSGASASGTSGSTMSSRLRRRRPAPARSPSPTASQMKAAAVERPAASSLPSLGACLNAIGLSSFTYDVASDGNCLFHALAHQLGYANGLARPGAVNVVYQNDAAQRELRRMAHTAVAARPEWDYSKGEEWDTMLNSILDGSGHSWQRGAGGEGAVALAPRGVAISTGRDVIIFSTRHGLHPRAELFPSDPAWRMKMDQEAEGVEGTAEYKPPRTVMGSVALIITDIGALKAWLDSGTPLPNAGDAPQPVKLQQPPLVIVHDGDVHYHSTIPRAPGRDEMVVPESPPPSPPAAAPPPIPSAAAAAAPAAVAAFPPPAGGATSPAGTPSSFDDDDGAAWRREPAIARHAREAEHDALAARPAPLARGHAQPPPAGHSVPASAPPPPPPPVAAARSRPPPPRDPSRPAAAVTTPAATAAAAVATSAAPPRDSAAATSPSAGASVPRPAPPRPRAAAAAAAAATVAGAAPRAGAALFFNAPPHAAFKHGAPRARRRSTTERC